MASTSPARGGRAALAWLSSARRYFAEAVERVTVVRDQDETIAGYGIAVTPANAPRFVAEDPLLGPRIAHARRHFPGGDVVIWRQAIDLTHARASQVTALLGMAGIIGSGLKNPAAAYLPIARTDAAGQAFSKACGAAPIAELAAEHGGIEVQCHLLDYGPGGLLAAQRATVYRELGLPAPPPPVAPLSFEEVRDALRHYGSPAVLAASPLAPVEGTLASRAQHACERIDTAVRDAFGPSRNDRQLRQALVRGYIDPAPTHELAASELHLSRTAYFRRLRSAVERVAAQLGSPASAERAQ
jgi:hypothetical protein